MMNFHYVDERKIISYIYSHNKTAIYKTYNHYNDFSRIKWILKFQPGFAAISTSAWLLLFEKKNTIQMCFLTVVIFKFGFRSSENIV